jgi:carbon monoxide dehydrogenase subunit G
MSLVKVSIDIDAPPDEVYDFVMNPEHFDEWVTIHRKLNHADDGPPREGYQLQQTLHLRGANFKVRWTLTECHRPRHATFEGRGPARSYARTSYSLSERNGGGTRFDYENEFKAPGGPLGAVASRALIGGLPEREANATLRRLKALLESR